MFRPMRRIDRETTLERAYEILKDSTYGVFTLHGDDNYPYGVPVNHIVIDGDILFHVANEGKKYDSLLLDNKCGFTAVASHEVVPEKITTKYASVICMGIAHIVEGEEKSNALIEIMKVYANEFLESNMDNIRNSMNRLKIIKIEVQHITGKENK